jgi:hypothetical protein
VATSSSAPLVARGRLDQWAMLLDKACKCTSMERPGHSEIAKQRLKQLSKTFLENVQKTFFVQHTFQTRFWSAFGAPATFLEHEQHCLNVFPKRLCDVF